MNPYEADNWQEVDSSNIAAIGTRDHYLIIKFNKGVAYRYPNGAGFFSQLSTADSVGKTFACEIKNQVDGERLPSEDSGWPEEGE